MKRDDFVSLSASVPYREGWTEGAHPADIEEAVVSLARAVFTRRGRLLFGGHPSISPLVSSVAGEYFSIDPERKVRPVVTFQSEWYRGRLPDETWEMHRMGFSAIEWTPKQETDKASLTLMREWMLGKMPPHVMERNKLTAPRAMIAVGGMEGILEEAAIFLRHRAEWNGVPRPPLYALKSGGAAATRLLEPGPAWEARLRLRESVSEEDGSKLRAARDAGELLDAEDRWRAAHAQFEMPPLPLPPYASIAQWLVDSLE